MKDALKLTKIFLIIGLSLSSFTACGQKDSVEEFDENDKKTSTRSRLTDGNTSGNTQTNCEFPLDLGTVVDPKRAGQTQTVLTTTLNDGCGTSAEIVVKVRSRSKITLVGRFACRTGQQVNEQVCSAAASEFLSSQRKVLTIPVIAEISLTNKDLEASVALYRSPF